MIKTTRIDVNAFISNKFIYCLLCAFIFIQKIEAQTYPFPITGPVTATVNVETTNTEVFKNTLLGYNIEGFNTTLQKDFIKLVDPVTIRFPHGVWANFYEWQDDTYQQDSYDNGSHQSVLNTYVSSVKGHIGGIAELNTERKTNNGGKGYDMMWTYSINFDDGPSSVARAQKDIALGLEVKAIELGNEHFWANQRANRTATPADYLREASAVSAALKTEFPNIQLSIPLGWRRNQEAYNNSILGDGNYFDAITVHKYIGADPDIPGESNSAYSTLLTAKLSLAEDVNWIRSTFSNKPVWLTEWGVSADNGVHAAACLGMADSYLFMSENQDIYHRSNWFSFNRILNAMVEVGSNREPVYPLKKRGYLMAYEILNSVLRDATMMKTTVSTATQLSTAKGAVNGVNARVVTKNGETSVVAINLTDQPAEFVLKFDNIVYAGGFKHQALVFNNLGVVANIDFYLDPLVTMKEGTGTITLPPLSINKISGIYLDPSIKIIEGTIEAEDYKVGGEGVGYSDTTPSNTLGAVGYTDGVDVGIDNTITYVGDTQNTEWLKYDVNVLATGNYDFEFVYAAASAGALVSIEIDDVVLFDSFSLPQTASGTDFQSIVKLDAALTQGLHVLKINVQNSGFNLDKININYVAPPAPPAFVSPNDGAIITPGSDIEVTASSSLNPSSIVSMELFIDNVSVRSISSAPFTWGFDGQSDTLLENKSAGTYALKLVLTDNRGSTSETTITVNSQNSVIQPYGGTPHPVPGTIQVEDYDLGGEGFAFHDTSIGNSGGAYRTAPGEDVDISADGSGFVSGSLSGDEYTRYTINVTQEGRYQMIVNYKTFSATSKPFAAYILPIDLSASTLLFSAPVGSTTSGIVNTGGAYMDYTSTEFDLTAGIKVLELRIPGGGAGPNYDYVTLNRIGTLGVDDIKNKNVNLKVYPVPSHDGKFNLSKSHKWKVYSLLGVKVLQGDGNSIDISRFSKGIYILKTETGISKRLVFN